ncbi:hypothetical protein QJQ45_028079, partial [Haematococcus lacustris]
MRIVGGTTLQSRRVAQRPSSGALLSKDEHGSVHALGHVALRSSAPVHLRGFADVKIADRARTRIRDVRAAAVAAPNAEAVTVVDQTFIMPKGNAPVQVTVAQHDNGAQTVRVVTPLQAGRLLLHWGVEGGKDYKGGWRLPAPSCRPEGTKQYKDRALQSPFVTNRNGTNELVIQLSPDEASDLMNFVLKDDATNNWWDNNSANFRVPLRKEVDTRVKPVDVLPKPLCDKWAWVRWDWEGRPPRSEQEATEEYERGVQEMKELMARGRLLDELWRVGEGKWKYADYQDKVIKPTLGRDHPAVAGRPRAAPPQAPSPAAAATPAPPVALLDVPIPEDLIAVQAYVLWERAGKPQGADFAAPARAEIESKLRAGKDLDQQARDLKYSPKWSQASLMASAATSSSSSSSSKAPASPPPPARAAPPPAPVQVGNTLGKLPQRNPLQLIKATSAPQLSADKGSEKREMPLDFLVGQFALDPATQWRRVFGLGSKSQMLAVVRQEHKDGPVQVDMFSDAASPLVMHWGVTKPGSQDWNLPPEEVWPEATHTSGHAAETPFVSCTDFGRDVLPANMRVPLQRVTVTIPQGSWVGGLIMVLRSSDSTMWYKDAGGNFHLPVPSKAAPLARQEGGDPLSRLPDDLSRAIVEAEVKSSAWTLMHRFNKAADLVNEVLNGYYDLDVADAFSRVFVWLRYSATRKLTWQRNYNTQPRILSAAQDRLTGTVASAHARTSGEAQEWVRLLLTTVGRGGDGQRIRDEILNIMHRNHIPEKKGLWMEEWHQKLHNNTTPDDVPICEAYLAYLESNGSMSAYWRTLSDAGITRQRLESYDRAITLEPQWFDGKKDALIRDFRNYLAILKAVHSGADLQASAAGAGN